MVSALAASPDGKHYASALSKGEICVWDAELETPDNHAINSVTFVPDGKSIMAASIDGTVTKWDTLSGY